jgi:predicted dienelactone hydrolase
MGHTYLRKAFWFLVAVLFCSASSADAAGIQLFNHGPTLSGAIWYPCQAKPTYVQLGDLGVGVDYGLVGVNDCPLAGVKLPLVIFSHGYKGWFGGHHDTAAALADAGFVVAAINHSGDNGNDTSRSDELSSFLSRPADLVRLLDFVLKDWKDKAVVDPSKIGLFGFSKGGYTGLALVGAAPDFARFARGCTDASKFCEQLRSADIPVPPQDACPGGGDCRTAERVFHEGQSGRHKNSAAVLACGTADGGRRRGPRGHCAYRSEPTGEA